MRAEQLNPGNLASVNAVYDLYLMRRIDEARPGADAAIKRFPGNALGYQTRGMIACLDRDKATLNAMADIGRSRRMPDVILAVADCAVREGRITDARKLLADMLEAIGPRVEMRSRMLVEYGTVEWRLGDPARARKTLDESDAYPVVRKYRSGPLYAEMGRWADVDKLVDSLVKDQPNATGLKKIWLPLMRAQRLLADSKPAEAIDVLRFNHRYDRRWPDLTLLRAEALLRVGDATAAIAEFEKLVAAPPVPPTTTVFPLSLIGLPRAYAAAGKTAEAKQAYDRAIAFWKDADPDFKLLVAARRERAALK